MEQRFFVEQMKRMADAFGEKAYTIERTDLIWDMVQDMRGEDFRRVVDHFVKTARHAPLPLDFDQATLTYRRTKNPVDESAQPPDCEHCKDVGFIRVRYHDDLEMKSATLMRCMCNRGTRHPNLFIPTWERGLEAAYKWASCPVEWFRPKDIKTEKGGITMESLSVVVESWKKRLSEADKFWRDLSIKETGS